LKQAIFNENMMPETAIDIVSIIEKCINENAPLKPSPGVYFIINLSNKKFYVGSSKNVYKRKLNHFQHLFNDKHNNDFLQKAFNKKPDQFNFYVYQYCDNFLEVEQTFLDQFSKNDKVCYNLSRTAIRKSPSEETKQRVLEQAKARPKTNIKKEKAMSERGRKILSDKLKEMHKRSPEIFEKARKKSVEIERETHQVSDKIKEFRKANPELTKKLTEACARKLMIYHDVDLLDPNDEIVTIGWNLREFCRKHNLDRANINKLINKKVKSHKGWKLLENRMI
jgi:group I intron endonuclease